MRLAITLERDETGTVVAELAAIPGCISQGRTEQEALANLCEAILGCLKVRADQGLPLIAPPRFTDTQGQYLAFIQAYTTLHRRPPAEADMQAYFQVTPPSVHNMVIALERHGLIRRRPRQARSIEVLVDPALLPVLR